MASYTFAPNQGPVVIGGTPFDFRQGSPLGPNFGMRVNQALNYAAESLRTAQERKQGGDLPTAGGAVGIAYKLRALASSVRTALLEPRQANPSSAELLRGQRPDGSFEPGYGPGGGSPVPEQPHVLPMWASDP